MNYLANALQQLCSSVPFGRGFLRNSRKRRHDDVTSVEGVKAPTTRAGAQTHEEYVTGPENVRNTLELQPLLAPASISGVLLPASDGNLLLPGQQHGNATKRIRLPSDGPLAPLWPKSSTQTNKMAGGNRQHGDNLQSQHGIVPPRIVTTAAGGVTTYDRNNIKSAAPSHDDPYNFTANESSHQDNSEGGGVHADCRSDGRRPTGPPAAAAACGASLQVSPKVPALPPLAKLLKAGCISDVLCMQGVSDLGHAQTEQQSPQAPLPEIQLTSQMQDQQRPSTDRRSGRQHVPNSTPSFQDSPESDEPEDSMDITSLDKPPSPLSPPPPPPPKAHPSAEDFLSAASASLQLISALSALVHHNVLPIPGDLEATLAHMYIICKRAGTEATKDKTRNPLCTVSGNTPAASKGRVPPTPRLQKADWLLTVLWQVEVVSSQYRGEISDVIYDYMDNLPASAKEPKRSTQWWRSRLLELQLEVLQACDWRVTITEEELATAVAELRQVGGGDNAENNGSPSSADCACSVLKSKVTTTVHTAINSSGAHPAKTPATGVRQPASFAAQLRNSFAGVGSSYGNTRPAPMVTKRRAGAKPRSTALSRLVARILEDAAWRSGTLTPKETETVSIETVSIEQ
ncbi:hypothetical protein Agub_g1016 [Astrephomene gubernaculifera]|uniref:Uncharacterized protein n=1 Tax=Astrephomene gubernaculifera TaxID=47775 RepID=A0AAD3HH53_9CHLO|nr:hypothetical protein Agub_g1016 [Astrephomene gubernaculifera]